MARLWPVLLLIGVWLLLRPYAGIAHDARLYAAQALHELKPEIFGSDMFFAFGSQDAFTLFSKLYAPLIDALGLPAAALAMVIAGQALWLTGAAALALRLTGSGAAAFAGLLLLAVMPGTYGGWQLLRVAEGFPTPRLLAEGLALWALWALTHRRLAYAGVLSLVSAALHPIMSAGAVLTAMLFLIYDDRRWLVVALLGIAGIAAGAWFGIPPLDRLLQVMDAEWFEIVQRNIYLYPGEWRDTDWSSFAFTLTLAIGGAAILVGWRRRLVLCGAAAAMIGISTSYVGADLLHDVLLTQLQLYRTMWLISVVGCVAAGALLVRVGVLRDGVALIALLALGGIVTFTLLPWLGVLLVAGAVLLMVARLNGRLPPLPRGLELVLFTGLGLLALALGVVRATTLIERLDAVVMRGHAAPINFAHVTMVDIAIVAAALLVLWRCQARLLRLSLPALAIGVFVGSLLLWDRRDEWSKASIDTAAMPAGWELPVDAQVFWENTVVGPWMILGRPSYVSVTQGGGIVFARGTAIAYRDRIRVIQPLVQSEMARLFQDEVGAHRPLPPLDRTDLVAACGQDPALDALVLSRAVAGSFAAAWDTPAPVYDVWAAVRGIAREPIRRFYLYRCSDLRDGTTNAALPSTGLAAGPAGTD